jgi:hypothetical protein
MITRRALALTGTAGLLAGAVSRAALAAPPSANDPVAIVNAIYALPQRARATAAVR